MLRLRSETVDVLDTSKESASDNSAICAICQSHSRALGELASPECCDHRFCLSCLMRWSLRVNTCPVCRLAYQLILVFDSIGSAVARTVRVADRTRVNLTLLDAAEDALGDGLAHDSLIDLICEECRSGDAEACLLICDGCERGMHTFCLQPPLDAVPPGSWYCPTCQHAQARRGSTQLRNAESDAEYGSDEEISADEIEELMHDADVGREIERRGDANRPVRHEDTHIYALRHNLAERERLRQRQARRRASLRSPSAVLECVRHELRARRRRCEQPCALSPNHPSGSSAEGPTESQSELPDAGSGQSLDSQGESCSLNVSTIGDSFSALTDSECASENTTLVEPTSRFMQDASISDTAAGQSAEVTLQLPVATSDASFAHNERLGRKEAHELAVFESETRKETEYSNSESEPVRDSDSENSVLNHGFCELVHRAHPPLHAHLKTNAEMVESSSTYGNEPATKPKPPPTKELVSRITNSTKTTHQLSFTSDTSESSVSQSDSEPTMAKRLRLNSHLQPRRTLTTNSSASHGRSGSRSRGQLAASRSSALLDPESKIKRLSANTKLHSSVPLNSRSLHSHAQSYTNRPINARRK